MGNPYGSSQYKQVSVQTATRGQVLIMLYEAAIRNLKKAMMFLDKKDLAGKGTHIVKAHDIVNELLNSLDYELGGDIAKNLDSLYHFVLTQITKGNVENSKVPLESALKVLETLLAGWRDAIKQVESGKVNTENK